MPKKDKAKTKKKAKQEEEEEEEEEDEDVEDEEEEEDEDEEEEEDEDKDEDEEEDEEEEEEEEEDEDEDEDEEEEEEEEEEDEEDEDEDKEEEEDDSSSTSSDSEEDDSEDDGKKKRKKKKGKDTKKQNNKSKKKGKDQKKNVKEEKAKVPLKGPSNSVKVEPKRELTIASVFEELEDLARHLSQTFTYFKSSMTYPSTESKVTPTEHFRRISDSDIVKNKSKTVSNPNPDFDNNRFLEDTKEVLDNTVQTKKQNPSPEAVRAVREYRERKEFENEKKYKDEGTATSHVFDSLGTTDLKRSKNNEEVEQKNNRELILEDDQTGKEPYLNEPKRNYSPSRSGAHWDRGNQLAENYYLNLQKKNARDVSPNRSKTLNDLYKYKPKPMFVESATKPIERYTANDYRASHSHGQKILGTQDKTEQRTRQSDYSGRNNVSVMDANRRQINEAMDILSKKSRININPTY